MLLLVILDNPAISNINFFISAGKMVAFVGRSGSGKTTLINLLTRFYDSQQGKIILDNYELNEYSLMSLRNQVALVSQDIHIFNDTIANNIALLMQVMNYTVVMT